MRAAEKNSVPIVELLLKNGADAGIEDWEGMTAMTYASALGNSRLIELLQAGK